MDKNKNDKVKGKGKPESNSGVIDIHKKMEENDDKKEFETVVKFNEIITKAINDGLELGLNPVNISLCLAAAANDLSDYAADEWADIFLENEIKRSDIVVLDTNKIKEEKKKEAKKMIRDLIINLIKND